MNNGYLMLALDRKIASDKTIFVSERLKDATDDQTSCAIAYSNLKDPLTSLLLGVFLGSFGAHRFYEGDKKLGIAYAISSGISFIMIFVGLFIMVASAARIPQYTESGYYELPGDFIAGFGMIIAFSLAILVIAIIGLIDGVLGYRRVQDKNFAKLMNAIDAVKSGESPFNF